MLESDVPPDTALMRYQAYSEAFLRPNLPWPESLNIGFTNRCHLRCIACHHSLPQRSPKQRLTDVVWESMRKVASQAMDITLAGSGESLLHRDFLKLIAQIGEMRPSLTVYTSMNAWGPGYAEALVDTVGFLYCSLDAARPETYRRIRKGGDFESAIERIREVASHRNARGMTKEDVEIYLAFMPMASNLEEMPELADLCARIGADSLLIQPLFEIVRLNESAVHPDLLPKLRDRIARTRERAASLGIHVHNMMTHVERGELRTEQPVWKSIAEEITPGESLVGFSWEKPAGTKSILECANCFRRIMILPGGLVMPCWTRYYPMGNLNHEPFEAIWQGNNFLDFRRRMLTAGDPPCPGCVCERWIPEPTVGNLASEIRAKDMSSLYRVLGWYDLEYNSEGKPFRWTNRTATLFLRNTGPASIIRITGYITKETEKSFCGEPLTVRINDAQPLRFFLHQGAFTLKIPVPPADLPFFKTDIVSPRTWNPKREYGIRKDSRDLGIIFEEAQILPPYGARDLILSSDQRDTIQTPVQCMNIAGSNL